jgi:branched-chain amino acid transport system permease protein
MFLELIKYGFIFGILLSLISLGFSLIYNILKIVDFAHADRLTIAGYSFYLLSFHLNIYYNVLISLCITAAFAILTERFVYSSMRKKGSSALMLTSFGFSIIVQSILAMNFSSEIKPTNVVEHVIGNTGFYMREMILIPISLLFLVFLTLYLKKTKTGISIRAIIANPERALFYKLPIRKYISIIFGISGLLAGVAGISLSISNGIFPTMGFKYMIYSFAACIIGGMKNLAGVVIISILLGVLIVFSEAYISSLASEAMALGILLLVLILKPNGIFGEKHREI